MAEMGVHSVAYAFPQVKIITTAVDKKVNDLFHIIPGIGETLNPSITLSAWLWLCVLKVLHKRAILTKQALSMSGSYFTPDHTKNMNKLYFA